MSISALSSNLVNDLSQQQRQNPFAQMRQDFNQLASALQAGDLSGAQTAYSNLAQLVQGGSNNPTRHDLNRGEHYPERFRDTWPSATDRRCRPGAERVCPTGEGSSGGPSGFQWGSTGPGSVRAEHSTANRADCGAASAARLRPTSQLSSVRRPVWAPKRRLQACSRHSRPRAGPLRARPLLGRLPRHGRSGRDHCGHKHSGNQPCRHYFERFQRSRLGALVEQLDPGTKRLLATQLQNDIQTAQQSAGAPSQSLTQGLSALVKGHHHHHHHGGGESSTQSSTSTTESPNRSGAGNAATGSGITINIYG